MILHQGKRYNQVRVLNPTPLDVNINGTTVVNDTLTDVNLTLVDQNGDDVPFTQTGTELEVELPQDFDVLQFVQSSGITDVNIIAAISDLVNSLKIDNVWQKLFAIYPLVGGTAFTHKFNLKDPRDHISAFKLVFSGGWVHDSNGITGNGINTNAKTNIIANNSLEFQSGSFGVYVRNSIPQSNSYEIGAGSTGFGISVRFLDDQFYGMYGTFSSSANTDSKGLFSVSRTTSRTRGFKNSVQRIDLADSPAIPASGILLGAIADGSRVSTANIAFAYAGEGLSNADITNLYNSIQTFQIALNRQV